jgi:hypothetical protein
MVHRTGAALLAAFLVVILGLTNASVANADPGGEGRTSGVPDPIIAALITNDDAFALADLSLLLASPTNPAGTQHYGPFPSSSPDSGTCGNDWAQDQFDRVFTVRQTDPTTYTVVQQFKNGTFVTNPGASPGACQFDDGSATTVIADGLNGTMHGYFVITVTLASTYNTDPNCVVAGPCTTTGFIQHHFPGSVFSIGTFFFHYAGYDGTNQVLIEHEWKNASDDRGGNHGDIATE